MTIFLMLLLLLFLVLISRFLFFSRLCANGQKIDGMDSIVVVVLLCVPIAVGHPLLLMYYIQQLLFPVPYALTSCCAVQYAASNLLLMM